MNLPSKFQILAELGRGGTGTVFKVLHTGLDRVVAVKVLNVGGWDDPETPARFEREARVMARFTHPNIVRVLDIDEHEDTRFMVMEFIDGADLKAILNRSGPMEPLRALEIAEQIASALTYAHAEGRQVVHRDIKPSNIIIESSTGRAVVTDFGIARVADGTDLTQARFLGTLRYSAPEQLRGDAIDGRTDLHALGLVLYELVVGAPALAGLTASQIVARSLRPEKQTLQLPADFPPDIGEIVLRATEREPKDRYPSAAAMGEAIKLAIAGRKLMAKPPLDSSWSGDRWSLEGDPQGQTKMIELTGGVAPKESSRGPSTKGILFGIGALLLALLLGFGIWSLLRVAPKSPQPPAPAPPGSAEPRRTQGPPAVASSPREGGEARPTATPRSTETPQPTATARPTETLRPTGTPRPTETPRPTDTPRATETARPTSTPRPTATPRASETPKVTETPRPTATTRPTLTALPTATPEATDAPEPQIAPERTDPEERSDSPEAVVPSEPRTAPKPTVEAGQRGDRPLGEADLPERAPRIAGRGTPSLEIVDLERRTLPGKKSIVVEGKVRNDGDEVLTRLSIQVEALNDADEVVFEQEAAVSPVPLEPGEVATFRTEVPLRKGVTNFNVVATGR